MFENMCYKRWLKLRENTNGSKENLKKIKKQTSTPENNVGSKKFSKVVYLLKNRLKSPCFINCLGCRWRCNSPQFMLQKWKRKKSTREKNPTEQGQQSK